MRIVIVGDEAAQSDLYTRVTEIVAALNFTDTIEVLKKNDEAYKMELGITESPALCIEEESIDFRDVIFQGILPEREEIKSLLISIVGQEEEGGSCGTGGCGTCSTDGGCH